LPLLVHGDAAFAGQGITAETLNLADLKGYSVGGRYTSSLKSARFTTLYNEEHSHAFPHSLLAGKSIPIFTSTLRMWMRILLAYGPGICYAFGSM